MYTKLLTICVMAINTEKAISELHEKYAHFNVSKLTSGFGE